jgi:hypothetical protein
MKKLLLMLLMAVLFSVSFLWADVQIGTGTVTGQSLPIEPYYGYTYSQVIYLQNEIQAAGQITAIEYQAVSTAGYGPDDIVIYMGHTDLALFEANTSWVDVNSLTTVYTGTLSVPAGGGVVTIQLDTPFSYNNSQNLIIAVDENTQGYHASSDEFNCSSSTNARGIVYYSDGTNPDPLNLTQTGTLKTYIANVNLVGITSVVPPTTPENPVPADAATNLSSFVSFSWSSNFTDTWDLYLNGSQIAQGLDVNHFTYDVALNYSTTYSWYVVAHNVYGFTQGPAWTFTVMDDPSITILPATENFDTVTVPTLPNGWSAYKVSTSTSAAVESYASGTPYTTPNHLKIANSNDGEATLLAITPLVITDNARVRFMAKMASSTGSLMVGTITNPNDPTTFVQLSELAITATYTEYSVPFTTTGMQMIAFKHGLGGTYKTIYIDDITFETIPAGAPNAAFMLAPANETTGLDVATSLSWSSDTSGPDPLGYNLFVGTDNPPTNFMNGTDIGNVTSYQLTNLAYTSTYYWQVVPYNNGGSASDCPIWSFTTMDDPTVTELPYLETFTTWPPTGWNLTGGTQTCVQYTNGDVQAARANFWSWSAGNTAYMVTPPVQLNGSENNEYYFNFGWSHVYSATYPTDALTVSISNDGGANWTDLFAQVGETFNSNDGAGNTAPGTFVNESYNVSAYANQTVRVRFYFLSGYGPDVFIDNVGFSGSTLGPIVNVAPATLTFPSVDVNVTSEPMNLTVSNLGGGSFDVTSVLFSGVDATMFAISGELTLPVTISEESLSIPIVFTPTSEGLKEAVCEITDSLGRTINTVALVGTGFVADGNDTPVTASVVAIPADSVVYSIDPVGDVDWYKLNITSLDTLTIFTERPAGDLDPKAWLYGPCAADGSDISATNNVATDDDGNGNLQPLINYVPVTTGIYFLRVAHYSNSPTYARSVVKENTTRATTGAYALTIMQEVLPMYGTISGTVMNSADNSFISDATVAFGENTTLTDANGSYTFTDVEAGTYTLTCSKEGFESMSQEVTVVAGETSTANFTLTETIIPNMQTPINLTGEIRMIDKVKLDWEMPVVGEFIHWDNDNWGGSSVGTNSEAVFDVASRWTPTDIADYNEYYINAIKFVPSEESCTYTLKIWQGGSHAASFNSGTLVYEQEVSNPIMDDYNIIYLDTPVQIDATQELWFGYECDTTTGYPAGTDDGTVVADKGALIYFDGEWANLVDLASTLTNNWLLQALVDVAPATRTAMIPMNRKETVKRPVVERHNTNATFSSITRSVSRTSREQDGFNIYRDGTLVGTVADGLTMSYLDENVPMGDHSYTVSALYGSNESEQSMAFAITLSEPNPYASPFGLDATAQPSQATVTWSMIESGAELSWGVDTPAGNSVGFSAAALIEQMARFDVTDLSPYNGFTLSSIDFVPTVQDCEYTIVVYRGGLYNGTEYWEGEQVYEQAVTNFVIDDWNTVILTTPVEIIGGYELWYGVRANSTTGHALDVDLAVSSPEKGGLIRFYNGGSWQDICGGGFTNWMLRGNVAGENTDLSGFRLYRKNVITNDVVTIDVTDPTARTFVDDTMPSTSNYRYSVTALYPNDGESIKSNEDMVTIVVSNEGTEVSPVVTTLGSNYPNPFNPTTTISFSTKEGGLVSIEVYNVKGQKVKTLVNDTFAAGTHKVVWNGNDDQNVNVGSGVYFYKMKNGRYTSTKKMILIK